MKVILTNNPNLVEILWDCNDATAPDTLLSEVLHCVREKCPTVEALSLSSLTSQAVSLQEFASFLSHMPTLNSFLVQCKGSRLCFLMTDGLSVVRL